jgi:hypothetical protein
MLVSEKLGLRSPMTQVYGEMLASTWILREAEARRLYFCPIAMPTNLVALVLSDPQVVWIIFIRGCYQQAIRVGMRDCQQIIAAGF